MSADEGVVDSGTRETLASGRRTIGEMLSAAQGKLQRVFIVFVVGLLATIYALRVWIWPILEQDLLAREADIIVITPFDVILLQAKIGIVVGILLSIPPLIYYSREPLKRRGWYPKDGVASWKLAGFVLLAGALFVGGVSYSYNLFFPVMFDFLANNAISAGLAPTYSIVDWTQFIFVLGLSFGIAAQLPLLMTVLSYTEIVPYETFRDKWKYAIVVMFGFGALFSPPDPFTQLMWAGPLVVLYAFSLYLARVAVAFKRGTSLAELSLGVRENANRIAAAFAMVAGGTYWFVTYGAAVVNQAVFPRIPPTFRPAPLRPERFLPLSGVEGAVALALALGVAVVLLLSLYYTRPSIDPGDGARMGDPTAIDLAELDARGIRSAPAEAFAELDDEAAVERARAAMEDGDAEKARAILDRFDEVQEGESETEEVAAGADAESAGGGGGLLSRTTGFVDAFTEEETTEEDVGGYYYDIAFVLDSLRSKTFRIFAVFLVVLSGVFGFLYSGGIGAIRNDFIGRLPAVVRPEEVSIITLHPVEALVFEVKIATLLGIVATVPLLLYYAWPALKDRGVASGDRNVFFGWAGALAAGLVVGSGLGYLYIAPAVVSYFVWDALQANMVIAYRVSNFFWLVFFTTVGIGLLLDVPITMILFHRGGIVSYQSLRDRWRVVTLVVLAAAAILTPASVLSMVLVTIPIMVAYGFGLAVLWIYTLGGRRTVRPAAESG